VLKIAIISTDKIFTGFIKVIDDGSIKKKERGLEKINGVK